MLRGLGTARIHHFYVVVSAFFSTASLIRARRIAHNLFFSTAVVLDI